MKQFSAVLSMIMPAIQAARAVETLGDALLDSVEEFVKRTDNVIDDATILPAIKGLRVIAGIADQQEQEEKPNLEVLKNES